MPGFLGGGFFGSGAKSAETNTTSQQSGFSEIGGSATSLNLSGGKNNINMTDLGAVMGGLDLAREALQLVSGANAKSTDALSSQVGQAYALANQARQSETSGAINNFLKYGAIVVGLAVAAWAFKGAR
jgi:hypothetical protein